MYSTELLRPGGDGLLTGVSGRDAVNTSLNGESGCTNPGRSTRLGVDFTRMSSPSAGPKEIGSFLMSIAPEGPSRVGSSIGAVGGISDAVAGGTYESIEVGIFIAQTVICSITCSGDAEQPVEDISCNL